MERNIIVITGPESSGKSALCEALSAHFKLPWVPEYARLFLEQNGPKYNFDIIQAIFQGHLDFQAQAKENQTGDLLILDTDSINFKVWSERVFNQSFAALDQQIPKEHHHHYLLCYPDLGWEDDPLRENPHDRLGIFKDHQNWIEKMNRPYRIVKGQKKERLKNALDALEDMGIRT